MNMIDLSIDQDGTEIRHSGTQLQPAFEKQKDHISLVYTVSSRPATATQGELVSKEKLKE